MFVILLFCGVVGGAMGGGKGHGTLGFFCGFLIGPVGLIVIALVPRRRDPLADLSAPRSTAPSLTPAASTAPAADATAALLDMKKLLDAGVVTQAEFDAKKKILLDRIGVPARTVPNPSASSVRYIRGIND